MTSSEMEFRCYRVTGRVQGVGFRWWTRKAARALGLVGRVRNEPDGSVRVRAAGPSEALNELEGQLGQGPVMARVGAVERCPGAEAGVRVGWKDFEIDSE